MATATAPRTSAPQPATVLDLASEPRRSTTTLVKELWDAHPEEATPFPPPVIPERLGDGLWGRVFKALTVMALLGGITWGSFHGVAWWLDDRDAHAISEATSALAAARSTSDALMSASARIADPDADAIALSEVSLTIVALDSDVLRLSRLSRAPIGWLERNLPLDDPLGPERTAYEVLADRAGAVSAQLGAALTARLVLDQFPNPPELPAGADPTTIEATTNALAGYIIDLDTGLRVLTSRDAVEADRAAVEAAAAAYVSALAANDPSAEALALALDHAIAALVAGVRAEVERLTALSGASAEAYHSTLHSMSR